LRGERDADFLDGLAVEIGNAPAQNLLFGRRDGHRLAVDFAERIVRAVNFEPQPGFDGRRIATIGNEPRCSDLARIDCRRRHKVVGAHTDDVGRRESRRRRRNWRDAEPLETKRESPAVRECDVLKLESASVLLNAKTLYRTWQRKM